MNTILEQINSTGKIFVEFALPMLVQSSVLILILLLTDFALRKKVRAVFRYGIWMLVLLKLVLPTSLSAPLSLGYWIGDGLAYVDISRTTTEAETKESTPKIVSPIIDLTNIQADRFTPTQAPTIPATGPVVTEPAQPPDESVTPLSWRGAVFLIWLTVVIAMGLLLLQRAIFVRGLVAQAKEANGFMDDTLESCRERMGVKRKLGLKVSANATSPAVCGLFRPVILVPQNLTSSLNPSQLRAVLLHELAHIKRGDLWVNLVQTVLQIIYFYNPLLWVANAMIRRIREQAVDEMVLVAMGEKARQYPQTLVSVAKLAFKRPALSLRLIGVVESKSALAGRIKHILNRPMPKRAKLGILGLLVVIIIAAILLPMATCTPGPPSLVIKGIVKDAQTGKPIAGARVFDDGYGPKPNWEQIKANERSEWGAITNTAGEYSFLTWPEHHSIKVEAPGYKAERQSLYDGHFVFNKKDEETFDFTLEPEKISGSSEFKDTLPNGITVELVGICEHPSDGKQWWRPDGQTITKPYERLNYTERSEDSNLYEVIYRLLGSDDVISSIYSNSEVSGHIFYELRQKTENLNIHDADNAYGAILLVKPEAKSIQLEIGTGRDSDWKTLCTQGRPVDSTGTTGPGVVFQPAIEKEGKTYITIAHRIKDSQIRIVAVDNLDRLHKAEGFVNTSGQELGSCQARFNLPADQIREIQFQTQKFQRAIFKNVSLKPNFKTDVQVEVEGAKSKTPQPVRNSISTARRYFSRVNVRQTRDKELVKTPREDTELFEERVGFLIRDYDDGVLHCIDFDNNRIVRVPDELDINGKDAILKWAKENNVDALFRRASSLVSLNMASTIIAEPEWSELSTRTLEILNKRVPGSTDILYSASGEYHYYAFKTSQGRIGVLGLASLANNGLDHRLLSIKYKLLKPDVQVEVEPVVGEWEDIGKAVPADFNDTISLAEHITLGSIGQNAEGKTFIALLRDREKTQNQQYRFILIRRNGTVLEPASYNPLLFGDKLWERFSFDMPYHHRQIKEFRLQRFPQNLERKASLPVVKPYDPDVNGKIAAQATLAPPGRGALRFDGQNDYLYVPYSRSLLMKAPFTVEMWIKPEFPKEQFEGRPSWGLIGKGCIGKDWILGRGKVEMRGFGITLHRFGDDPNLLMVDYCAANAERVYTKPYGRSDFDDWMHLYHVFRPDRYQPGHFHPLVIGRFLTTEHPFAGQIGEVRIWAGVRSRDQISEYRNKPLTGDESDLVACWTFEQSGGQIAYDISNHRNHARLGRTTETDDADPTWVTVTGGNTPVKEPDNETDDQVLAHSTGGPVGQHALSFDGINDYLHVASNSTLTLKPPFTIEMWLKPDYSDIPRTKDSEKLWPFLSLLRKGKRLFQEKRLQAGGFLMSVRPPGPSSQPDWRCSAGLYLGNEKGLMYQVDGFWGDRLQPARPGWLYVTMSCTRETYIPVPDQPLLIGGENIVPSGFPFKGEIAEIRIWNKVLTDVDLLRYGYTSLAGSEPNLVACWDFKRPGGQIVFDISPNGNHARLGGSEGPDDADPKWVNLKLKAASHQPDQKTDVQVEGEKPQSLIFHGLDLTAVPHTTNFSKLPDLFEERPLGSKSYHIQKDVTAIYSGLDGTVYFIPRRNIFYVQHDKLGSSTLTYYGPFEGNPVQVLNLQPDVQVEDTKIEPGSSGEAVDSSELTGRVVDENGNAMADAQVALSTEKIGVLVSNGKLQPIRSGVESRIVQTDSQGMFDFGQMPVDNFDLIVAHEKGFALVESEDFIASGEIHLQSWGHINGQLAEGRKAAGNMIWMSSLPNSSWFRHKREYRDETKCDESGHFVFDKVPSGWFEVGYLTRSGKNSWSFTSRTPVVVKTGQTTKMRLGGEGRPVTGRFVLPEGYDKSIYFGEGLRSLQTVRPKEPRPDNYDRMTKEQQRQWREQWHKTDEYKKYRDDYWHHPDWRQYTFFIEKDGSFHIDDVIAGKYQLSVWIEERHTGQGRPEEIAGYYGTIEVPEIPGGRSDEPLDLGELELTMHNPLRVGDIAPLFEAKTLDGKDLRLIDYRGKFVLLSFWQPVFHPEKQQLQELYDTYGGNRQLEIIGLGGNDTLDEVKNYVRENAIPWPQIYTGEEFKSGIAKDYGGFGIFLIDPDGRIIAKDLRGEKLKSVVSEILEVASKNKTNVRAEVEGR